METIATVGHYKPQWFEEDKFELKINLREFKGDRDRYIERLNGIYKRNLDNSGVDHIQGHAKFLDNNTLECDGQVYQAEHICIETGSKPNILDIPGKEHSIIIPKLK